ncbi:MAG: leucyl/phenylalanyl-tRNA--protein transferase [Desulfobacterales bacterium]|nr:leucyl/phenylalanyl-tRNA--protein transferase [Desulfobacterales bacterium]
MPVYLLNEQIIFPPAQLAREDGLLAVGGDLSPDRLLLAYRQGIFPWFMDAEPILWWSPDPRLVLYPAEFRPSRSLHKKIRQNIFRITMDQAFNEVITACARTRQDKDEGTWIGADMINAYSRLYESGFAHSVEAWYEDKLAGGVYGVSLGRCFFGESMFTLIRDASKVALAALVSHLRDNSFEFIDCQITSPHFIRLGAREMSRTLFLKQLAKALEAPTVVGRWTVGMELNNAD